MVTYPFGYRVRIFKMECFSQDKKKKISILAEFFARQVQVYLSSKHLLNLDQKLIHLGKLGANQGNFLNAYFSSAQIKVWIIMRFTLPVNNLL